MGHAGCLEVQHGHSSEQPGELGAGSFVEGSIVGQDTVAAGREPFALVATEQAAAVLGTGMNQGS